MRLLKIKRVATSIKRVSALETGVYDKSNATHIFKEIMNQEDYACDKFAPQKVKNDFCRHCFQPKRLHELKTKKSKPVVQHSSGVSTRGVAAGIESVKHAERKQQQKEENLQPKVSTTPETQLPTASEQECSHVSDEKPEAVDSKVPADSDVTNDEQVTMDDVCVSSNSDMMAEKRDDKETEQLNVLNEGNDGNTNERRSEDIVSEIPLDNNASDTKDADISSRNVTASLGEGNTGNSIETKEIHSEGGDSKDIPLLVEESSTSHAEELPTKSCLEEARAGDTHERVAVSSTPLVEDTLEGDGAPDESGLEEQTSTTTTTTHVEDDHVNTSTRDVTSTLPSSSVQDNAVPSLNAKQLDGEKTYEDDGQLVSTEAGLPQLDDDVTSPLVANDPAPPTLAATDNQVPPMVVNDQGVNIPVPPSPPPIRAPPRPPPPPNEEPPSPESPSGNESMLSPQVSCISYWTMRSL